MNAMSGRSYLLVLSLLYLIWLSWLGHYPFDLTSDDAVNFSRAVERFSVLEFRPHFPGYPAFVSVSRIAALLVEGEVSNVWISYFSAIAIPALVFAVVYRCCGDYFWSGFAALIILLQPLMASVALSGLTDSLGVACLLLSLVALFRGRYGLAGLCVGLMLSTRPSYFPLAIGFIIAPLIVRNGRSVLNNYLSSIAGITLVGLLSFIFIWLTDGATYIDEGIRFTQGHFSIWGNTKASDLALPVQWLHSLLPQYGAVGLSVMFASLCIAVVSTFKYLSAVKSASTVAVNTEYCRQSSQVSVVTCITVSYLIWVFVAQNPDNLRHWLPIVVLFSLLIALQLCRVSQPSSRYAMGPLLCKSVVSTSSPSSVYMPLLAISILAYFALAGLQNITLSVTKSPSQQAIEWISARNEIQVIGTNYSVNLLRDQLADRSIFDMYYASSQLALNQADSAWRLSATKLADQTLEGLFPARFSGERSLYLYRLNKNKE